MKRWFVAVGLVVAVGLSRPVMAQQSATLVLRSGERIGGDLVDMGASGLTFRVSGRDRIFPASQVAVIDFVGGGTSFPASELDQVGDGGVVTTGGQAVRGTLYDVGGRSPLRITIQLAGGGTRDFASSELRRIYLSRPPATATPLPEPLPSTPGSGRVIRVPGNQQWVDTGITVRRGDRVTFNATGQVQLSSDASDVASPAGSKTGRRPSGPLPQTLAGALIGRIGPTQMIGIGDQTVPVEMPVDGRLFMGINDDHVGDNSGEFRVTVTHTSGAPRRR